MDESRARLLDSRLYRDRRPVTRRICRRRNHRCAARLCPWTPAGALFPLFLFFFGLGDTAKIAIVVYACSLIILVNTTYGARQVKELRILSAHVMGANQRDIFWQIV